MAVVFVVASGVAQPLHGQPLSPAGNDPQAACDAYERASAGDAAALHNLATCYFSGQGRTRDPARARELYRQAVDRGFSKSMCGLGNLMIRGEGGAHDVDGGLALCRRAAEAGDADAQADLGSHFLGGGAVTKDSAAARKWLTLAAEQRHANAAIDLGKMHWNGDGGPKDNAAAARWWRVARDGGRPDAAFLLGNEAFVRLVNGARRPEDANPKVIAEALAWFDIAVRTDPDPSARRDAATRADMLRQLKQGLEGRR